MAALPKPTILAALLLLASLLGVTNQSRADPVAYELYASLSGWGFTPSTITSPGPRLTAAPGETVVLTLRSTDFLHNFYVDYNGNNNPDAGEPLAPNFGSSPTTFTFTARTTQGVFRYWCFIHQELGQMFGDFEIVAVVHDVATTSIAASRNFAYNSVPSDPVRVDVTVANQGTSSESFTVTARANSTLIGSQSVTVPASGSTTVSFNWNPEVLPRGTYRLNAQASQVTGETDLLDNNLEGSVFTVRMRGDVNGDCIIDIIDLATVGAAFGSTPGIPRFNSNADLNNDRVIDIIDLATVGSIFGKSC